MLVRDAIRLPAWLEWEVVVLALFVGATFFLRLSDVPLLGEETRRALIGREMVRSGDWIVPHQQGVPWLTKPPIQYWAIAVSTSILGETRFAIRLPSVVAILCTALVIYGYTRSFLSRAGAMASALSFLTAAEILHSGRFAQIDPLFTLFLSAALLVWHWGYSRNWASWLTWSSAYALAALAALTKGPQAPVYFAGGVGLYLLIRRDWRYCFSAAHALGLAVFAAILGAWLVPFWLLMGTEGVIALWVREAAFRSNVFQQSFLGHLIRFPGEFFVCALPCSLLLLVYLSRKFRSSLGEASGPALFLFVCIGFAFPTCWIPPLGEARYLMPLYPCLGCLAGIVLERLVLAQASSWLLRRFWQMLRFGNAILMLAGVAVAVLWVSGLLPPRVGMYWPSSADALLYSSIVLGLLGIFWRASRRASPSFVLVPVTIGCFLALTYNWAVVGRLRYQCLDMEQAVAQAAAVVPEGTPLVSLDSVHHRFVYYYPEHIRVLPWRQRACLPSEDVCFCVDSIGPDKPALPFAWKVLATVPVDRYRRNGPPEKVVVIGRRVPEGKKEIVQQANAEATASGRGGE